MIKIFLISISIVGLLTLNAYSSKTQTIKSVLPQIIDKNLVLSETTISELKEGSIYIVISRVQEQNKVYLLDRVSLHQIELPSDKVVYFDGNYLGFNLYKDYYNFKVIKK